MNTLKMLVSFFLYTIHGIIGIIIAKKTKFPALLGGIFGFLFIPVFVNFLPLISKRLKEQQ